MPNLVAARAAIIGRVNTHWSAAYPTVKMYYDNAFPTDSEIDGLSTYVLCSIRFTGGAQMDLGLNPHHRIPGRVRFTAAAREGAGSSKVLEYLDSLTGAMKFAQFGGVTTKHPMLGVPDTEAGWFSYDLSIPFFVDSIT